MKSRSVKADIAFLLAVVMMVTCINFPTNSAKVYAKEDTETTSGNETTSENKIKVCIENLNYLASFKYNAEPIDAPGVDNIKITTGDDEQIVVDSAEVLDIKWYEKETESAELSALETAPVNVGEYIVTVSMNSAGKYYLDEAKKFEVTIEPKEVKVAISGRTTKEYDGNTKVTNVSEIEIASEDIIGADKDKVAIKADYLFASKKAEKTAVSVNSIWLEGEEKVLGNYIISEEEPKVEVVGEITKRPVTVTLSGSTSKEYDGNENVTDATGLSLTVNNAIAGDDVRAVLKEDWKFEKADAGENLNISGKAELVGDDALNYRLSDESVSGNCGIITKSTSEISKDTQTTLNNLTAYCGQKLSEIELPDGFTWKNGDKVLNAKESPITAEVIYDKDGASLNYEATTGQALVTVKHDLQIVKEQKPVNKKKTKKAGVVEHKHCKGCNKNFDNNLNELSDEEMIIPVFDTEVELTIGKKLTLDEIMLDGSEACVSIQSTSKKNAKYIKVKSDNSIEIASKYKNAKNYKNLPQKIKLTVKCASGKEQKITVKLNAPAPKKKSVKINKKAVVVDGVEAYRYTITYNIKNASKINVVVDSGVETKTKTRLNKALKSFFKKRKGGKGVAYFTIRKEAVKKKIQFKIVANYGKMESQPLVVKR